MWNHLKQTDKPILLYGMGDGADKVLRQCALREISVAGVFASDGFARHNLFHGYTVVSYSEAKARYGDMLVLVCFGTHRPEVMELIRQVAAQQELYIPDVPVAGDTIFDRDFCRRHQAEIQAAYALLADDQSRVVFRDIIQYKLTGRPEYLDRCATPARETYALLELGDAEHYVDLGAYRGDTVEEFLRAVNGKYAGIVAVEPEKSSFQKLQCATASLTRCRCVQAVMSDRPGTVLFQSGRGRGSGADKAGKPCPAESLDHLLQGGPATYLNIDVEGNEALVLAGAARTIQTWRPKILLAAYHRSEDLFALPLQMQALRPDYRIHLRHWPCYPAWDINYIFT